jgi:archaemetzincin
MWKLATIVLLLPLVTMAFEPPSSEMQNAAVGDLSALPPLLQPAFASDSPDLRPIPKPGPHDWLASHREPGQTFDDFLAMRPNRPTSARRVIYLQPLGEFPPEGRPLIAKLCDFAAAFFAMEVKALPEVRVGVSFTTRRNPSTGNLQILTGDVLNFLKSRLPSDAFCIVSITMADLYPGASWELRIRSGVTSGTGRGVQLRALRSCLLWRATDA